MPIEDYRPRYEAWRARHPSAPELGESVTLYFPRRDMIARFEGFGQGSLCLSKTMNPPFEIPTEDVLRAVSSRGILDIEAGDNAPLRLEIRLSYFDDPSRTPERYRRGVYLAGVPLDDVRGSELRSPVASVPIAVMRGLLADLLVTGLVATALVATQSGARPLSP